MPLGVDTISPFLYLKGEVLGVEARPLSVDCTLLLLEEARFFGGFMSSCPAEEEGEEPRKAGEPVTVLSSSSVSLSGEGRGSCSADK